MPSHKSKWLVKMVAPLLLFSLIIFEIVWMNLIYIPQNAPNEREEYENANVSRTGTANSHVDSICNDTSCLLKNTTSNNSETIIPSTVTKSNMSVDIVDNGQTKTSPTDVVHNGETSANDLQETEKIGISETSSNHTNSISNLFNASLPLCSEKPPNLVGYASIVVPDKPLTMNETERENPLIRPGGYFIPAECKANWKVAILIPFRNRDEHLHYFLHFMHPILQRQLLEYRVYVINQIAGGKFNRAKLLNVGFVESTKDYDFDCFVFHDVDLILENDNVVYNCPDQPRHLAHGMSNFNYRLPYKQFFGGVTELTKKQFEKINGYSNNYWGWGGEDDDLYGRVRIMRMNVIRFPLEIAKYKMIKHERDKGNEVNPNRFSLLGKTYASFKSDGLNHLTYKVISRTDFPLYTNITVDIFPPDS